jgi:hypothetical protein
MRSGRRVGAGRKGQHVGGAVAGAAGGGGEGARGRAWPAGGGRTPRQWCLRGCGVQLRCAAEGGQQSDFRVRLEAGGSPAVHSTRATGPPKCCAGGGTESRQGWPYTVAPPRPQQALRNKRAALRLAGAAGRCRLGPSGPKLFPWQVGALLLAEQIALSQACAPGGWAACLPQLPSHELAVLRWQKIRPPRRAATGWPDKR